MPEPPAEQLQSILPDINHNPDVLSCLANLSNDEVFTPPSVANAMLDLLPQELFTNPETTFLDPVCKSGVFLREITKRLVAGLADQMSDLQERVDHILHKQVFGIAITELTSLLSRRTLYCSKYPNSPFSISNFDSVTGNIRYKAIYHTWKSGKCVFCGASQGQYERKEGLETHAYEFIHTDKPQGFFQDMKFDVIIGNPPYQLDTGGSGKQAKPIYNKFIEISKSLNPNYLIMIIPSRWFAGGMGLDSFRLTMMNDQHISKIFDYINAKDCFPQNSISGGVCYFLWDKNHNGKCNFTSINSTKQNCLCRSLKEFSILVRYNQAVTILRKINKISHTYLIDHVSSISPFGLSTKERGKKTKNHNHELVLYSSAGVGYIEENNIQKGQEYINSYKVMVSQTGAEHAGEPDQSGTFRVLTSAMRVLEPKEICTHSYIIVGNFNNKESAINLLNYLKTKFARLLLLLAMSSIHLSKTTFSFVPTQDFSKPWTDAELYAKYNLSQEERDFIESMIKPMDLPEDTKTEANHA